MIKINTGFTLKLVLYMLRYSKKKANLTHLKSLMSFTRDSAEVLTFSSLREHCMCNSYFTGLPEKSTASIKVVSMGAVKFMLLIKK